MLNSPRSFISPLVEIYAQVHEGRDEGLLELDFRDAGQCELAFFGVTARLIRSGADRWLMNRALELSLSRPVTCGSGCTPALSITRRRWRSISAGFRPFRRQVEIADDPTLDGTAPRDAARHVPIIV
jgi:hypothetical protein